MTFTQNLELNWSGAGSAAVKKSIPVTGDTLLIADVPLVNGTVTQVLAARNIGLGLIYMLSDVDVTVTFRDAGGTSVGTKALTAGRPFAWLAGMGTIPIADDAFLVDCVAAATGTLQIRGIQDGSPALATAVLTGTLVSSHLESGIVSGGYTAILTLTGAVWVPAGAAFNAQRQAIIDGLVAATSQTDGWNNDVKPAIPVANVVRTSNTQVTITLPAVGTYDIASNETITATIPAPATSADAPIVATPTVTITAGA